MTAPTYLLHALAGGIFCAIVSALLAPLYDNHRGEVAIVGFAVGAVAQVLLVLLVTWLGWSW